MTEWCTTRSMAAAVAMGLAQMRSHSQKNRFDMSSGQRLRSGESVPTLGSGGDAVVKGVLDSAQVLVGEAGGHGGQEAFVRGLGVKGGDKTYHWGGGMEPGGSDGSGRAVLGGGGVRISPDRLSAEAGATGFREDVLEKVAHLLGLLDALRSHPFLEGKPTLKGGTALNLFVFDVPRLSVDIDLNYLGAESRDAMLEERPRIEDGMLAVFQREAFDVRQMPEEHAGGKWSRFRLLLGFSWGHRSEQAPPQTGTSLHSPLFSCCLLRIMYNITT